MITITCETYPSLLIADLGVQLDGGVAHVSNPAVAARLTPGRRKALAALGVTVSDDDATGTQPSTPESTPSAGTGTDADGDEGTDRDEDDDTLEPPAGNASTADWAAYAARLGIDVPDGARRDEIRDLIDSIVGDDDEDDEAESTE